MRSIIFAAVLSLTLGQMLCAGTPANIPDPILKSIIEEELQILDPTPTDLLSLTSLVHAGSYNAETPEVSDLTGLEYAINLELLSLSLHSVRDLTPLSCLTQLRILKLNENDLFDISPLGTLTQLTGLDIHDNPNIQDYSPLSSLSQLEYLIIRKNELSSIPDLSRLVNLVTLDLQYNNIRDLSSLTSLERLETLRARSNRIEDIVPLLSLPTLLFLDLQWNPLNREAYREDLYTLVARRPGIDLRYSPSMHAPTSFTASKYLYPGRVRLTWHVLPNGPLYSSHYRVTRRVYGRPGEPWTPISEWQQEVEYEDDQVLPNLRYDYSLEIATDVQGSHARQSGLSERGWVTTSDADLRLYVDQDPGDLSDPGESAEFLFTTIQEAVDFASEGARNRGEFYPIRRRQ